MPAGPNREVVEIIDGPEGPGARKATSYAGAQRGLGVGAAQGGSGARGRVPGKTGVDTERIVHMWAGSAVSESGVLGDSGRRRGLWWTRRRGEITRNWVRSLNRDRRVGHCCVGFDTWSKVRGLTENMGCAFRTTSWRF